MTDELWHLTLKKFGRNPWHQKNIYTPVISTGTMSVLMGCHMTSQVMSFTKFFTTDIAFEPVTLMFLLITTNQEDNSWCLWSFWGLPDISTPNFSTMSSSTTKYSNQNFPTSSEICWVVKRRCYLSKNSPEIETSSFLHNILLCILVTVKLGLKSLGLDLVAEMLRVEMLSNH